MKYRLSILAALLCVVVIAIWPMDFDLRWSLWACAALTWTGVTAYGSYAIEKNWFYPSVNETGTSAISLTFDDGPDPVVTPRILAILKEHGATATFFMIGRKAEANPHLVRQIINEGHQIGSHSYSHSDGIAFYSKAALESDIRLSVDVLERITDQPVRLFRPPFGVTNPRYPGVLEKLKLVSVGWTLRSYDTVTVSREKLLARLWKKTSLGQIVLFHDNLTDTAEILPEFLELCRVKNLKIEALKIE